uniref:Ig-like domain-containing protein n=1 Tax=Kryptolebias marmoratus TaxID=37003 RepID=A0A3Q2ZRF3_KRYMA
MTSQRPFSDVELFTLTVSFVEQIWSEIYLGESVLLQCRLDSNSTSAWTYRWYRKKTNTTLPLNPRHLVSDDSYFITAVTREDAGSYWCKAEQRENGDVILKTPAFPVYQGGTVVLYCQYRTSSQIETTFFKNGIAINTAEKNINLTIKKVTQEQEGLYKCGSRDRMMESQESWLSVTLDGGQMFCLFKSLIFTKTKSYIIIVLFFRQFHIKSRDLPANCLNFSCYTATPLYSYIRVDISKEGLFILYYAVAPCNGASSSSY